MSATFRGYAVRSGDLWWAQSKYNFIETPDETSFTPTRAGSAVQRIARNIKMFTKNVEILTAQYTPEYFTQRRSLTYPEAMEQIAGEAARLVQWQNARVVEVTLNVMENQ